MQGSIIKPEVRAVKLVAFAAKVRLDAVKTEGGSLKEVGGAVRPSCSPAPSVISGVSSVKSGPSPSPFKGVMSMEPFVSKGAVGPR